MHGSSSFRAQITGRFPEPELLGAIQEFVTGSRTEIDEADRFLATVLVVDVVGSTEHASELGDRRWSRMRDRFEDVVRQSLIVHGGEVVDVAGDGVLATFDGPARAIRCAARMRDDVRRARPRGSLRSSCRRDHTPRGEVSRVSLCTSERACRLSPIRARSS